MLKRKTLNGSDAAAIYNDLVLFLPAFPRPCHTKSSRVHMGLEIEALFARPPWIENGDMN